VDVSIEGVPGEIAIGSGWHEFSMNVLNTSGSTLKNLGFFFGVSPHENGSPMFTSNLVNIEAWDPDGKSWYSVGEDGDANGYAGYTDELKPGYEVDIALRIRVLKNAPVGAGFTVGLTSYSDTDGGCGGHGESSYEFQIVAAGTDTSGTKPQEGGKAPVPDKKPDTDTPKLTGTLASTGSSSALPVIGLVGGAAVVAGTGAVFVVRRRRAAAATDA
jgi:LPXTG-motif cell wall-anchored protein